MCGACCTINTINTFTCMASGLYLNHKSESLQGTRTLAIGIAVLQDTPPSLMQFCINQFMSSILHCNILVLGFVGQGTNKIHLKLYPTINGMDVGQPSKIIASIKYLSKLHRLYMRCARTNKMISLSLCLFRAHSYIPEDCVRRPDNPFPECRDTFDPILLR